MAENTIKPHMPPCHKTRSHLTLHFNQNWYSSVAKWNKQRLMWTSETKYHKESRTREVNYSRSQEFEKSRIPEVNKSRNQEIKNSRIQEFKNSRNQEVVKSTSRELKKIWSQKLHESEVKVLNFKTFKYWSEASRLVTL